MTNQRTLDKLIEMRLASMADAFRIQMDDSSMKEVPFENRFSMLVDVEYSKRKNNRLKRLIRLAELEQPDASIAAIDYQSGRKLNKTLNTATSLLPDQLEAVKPTWPVPLVWKPVSIIIRYSMYAFLIYYWTYRQPEIMAHLMPLLKNTPSQYC